MRARSTFHESLSISRTETPNTFVASLVNLMLAVSGNFSKQLRSAG